MSLYLSKSFCASSKNRREPSTCMSVSSGIHSYLRTVGIFSATYLLNSDTWLRIELEEPERILQAALAEVRFCGGHRCGGRVPSLCVFAGGYSRQTGYVCCVGGVSSQGNPVFLVTSRKSCRSAQRLASSQSTPKLSADNSHSFAVLRIKIQH